MMLNTWILLSSLLAYSYCMELGPRFDMRIPKTERVGGNSGGSKTPRF